MVCSFSCYGCWSLGLRVVVAVVGPPVGGPTIGARGVSVCFGVLVV